MNLGGKFLDCMKVEKINPVNDKLVQVITNDEVFWADAVVLTCGPWANKILQPLNLQLPLKVVISCDFARCRLIVRFVVYNRIDVLFF